MLKDCNYMPIYVHEYILCVYIKRLQIQLIRFLCKMLEVSAITVYGQFTFPVELFTEYLQLP